LPGVLSSSAMAARLDPPKRPVEFEFDGETLTAEEGEPLLFALLASDKLALSRSPKLHRPHGPYCLRGGCDGCLLRVNGEPNVMTCMLACRGGERVSTQNVLGSRKIDLMEVTDWFFPRGIDHHHFLAGVPAASFVVQKVARHVAGFGKLPDTPRPTGEARREDVDVLVVGGGAAGLTVALRLARAKGELKTLVVDDAVSPGGSLRARGEVLPDLSSLNLYRGATAAGVYEREVLVVRDDEAIVVRPRTLVLATGTHDGVAAFPGNDLPGVLSARAGALLARHGIAIGKKVALLGAGPYSEAFLERMRGHVEAIVVPAGASVVAEGRGRIAAMRVRERGTERSGGARGGRVERYDIDALLVEAPGAPCFELAEQAGAQVAFDGSRGGYVPVVDSNGRALSRQEAADNSGWVWCAGELAGTGPSLATIRTQAETVAGDVLESIAAMSSPR